MGGLRWMDGWEVEDVLLGLVEILILGGVRVAFKQKLSWYQDLYILDNYAEHFVLLFVEK
jgi:hypothetical protein